MASRVANNYPAVVYKTYPLFFWKLCDKCRKEFRREWGWHYVSGPYFNGRGHRRYLCHSCADIRGVAAEYASGIHNLPPRPPAPPGEGSVR